jgi:hypothetical protein
LEPTLISGIFEDVIVQNEPAAPVYCEHSFVTWSAPFWPEDAETEVIVPNAVVRTTKLRNSKRVSWDIILVTLLDVIWSFPFLWFCLQLPNVEKHIGIVAS